MSWLDRLRNAFRPDAVSEDIEREMAFHLNARAADLERHGMTSDAARAEARRRFGRTEHHGEETRDRDLFGWLESLVTDARYAMRGLRGAPGFAAVAILSLSLGIGANTAIFTMLNVAMFKTLPVPNPEELVELRPIGTVTMKGPSFSPRAFEVLRERQDVFSNVFAYGSTGSGDLSTGGEMRSIPVGLVTGGFFATLGVRPAVGRLLSDADDKPGCGGSVVLTHSFWQTEFGGDASAVGRIIRINGRPFEIIGVAEPDFFGLGFGYYPPVWGPQCAGPLIRGPMYSGGGAVIGRLKPGITIEQAKARLASLAPALAEASQLQQVEGRPGPAFAVEALPFTHGFGFIREEYGSGLLVLMGIVGVVLLISCANTANLLLARATARRREVAVRLALGAGAGRLIRQLFTESLILALASAALGILLGQLGTRLLVALLSREGRPFMKELAPDTNVLLFTTGLAVLTAIIFGLVPAWRAVRVRPESAMRVGGRGELQGHSRFSVAKGLVVAQIALSLVMLSGAGLLVESWRRTIAVELGFRPEGVVLVTVNTRPAAIPDSQRLALYTHIVERVRSVPGVQLASAAVRTPFGNSGWTADIDVDGSRASDREVSLNEVSPGYFATIGARLVAGRDFGAEDKPGGPRVAIVNREVVRRFFDEGHPESRSGEGSAVLNRTFRIDWGRGGAFTYQVVGIVEDTRELSFTERTQPVVYFAMPRNPRPDAYMNIAARGNVSTSALATAVKTAIMDVDPRLTLRTRTLQSQLDDAVRIPRTLGLLSSVFGVLALVLAMIGLYGIMAYSVARRRNEIGVRIALGADKSRIVRMVLADVGRITIAGVVGGVLLALGAQRMLAVALTGIASSVAGNLAWSAAILALVAIAAASLPAWRASRQDPVSALRTD
jgi:putative ABC transport system permease protein